MSVVGLNVQHVRNLRDENPFQVGELIWVNGNYQIIISSSVHDPWTNIAFSRELKVSELEKHGLTLNLYHTLRRLTGHQNP
jgi:hypothetical protein